MPEIRFYYRDYWDLRGDGRIVLCRKADHRKPKWTVRLKIPDNPGFVVKSTKTTDDFEARRFAEALYFKLEGRAVRGEPINSPTFRKVFAEWSKVPLADRKVRNARYIKCRCPESRDLGAEALRGPGDQSYRRQRSPHTSTGDYSLRRTDDEHL